MTLTCRACDSPGIRLIDDNGVTDPADGDRWERFECEDCGHTYSQELRA